MKKLPYEPISIRPPKGKEPPIVPSLHPFMWMAAEFIRKVPLDEIKDEKIRRQWKDYQECATSAIEFFMDAIAKITMPYPDLDERELCLNQRIQEIIDPRQFTVKMKK